MKKSIFATTIALMSMIGLFAKDRPNILVIWGDDIGFSNISINSQGMMGYQTPNIDPIGKLGAVFTDWYAENMWLFVPAQAYVGQFLQTFQEFPPVQGSSLSVDNVLKTLQTKPHN